MVGEPVHVRMGSPPPVPVRILFLASLAESLVNFRKPLIKACSERGCDIYAMAPKADPVTLQELDCLGVSFEAIRLSRTGNDPIEDILLYWDLKQRIRRISPDTILAYTIKPVIYGALAARACHVKNVYALVTGVGYLFQKTSWKGRLMNVIIRPMYRRALDECKGVFFQNRDNLSLFVKEEILRDPGKAVLVNGSGVDLNHFSLAPPFLKPVTFLLIARMLYDKGISEFVEAARILKPSYPGARFRILGPVDSNPAAIPLRKLEEWHGEGVIEYLPETRDVRPFLAETSVYVLPSYHEGIPRTVLEAMAMGRPVVTTDAPGCRETIIDGESGYLVPVRNAPLLAEAMERFLKDPARISLMGEAARRRAETTFDVEEVNRVLLSHMGIV